jgi:hypothetical protein
MAPPHLKAVPSARFLALVKKFKSRVYEKGSFRKEFARFKFSGKKLKTKLISTDWSVLLQRMQAYQRLRFSDDMRIVALAAFTPRGTLRVEWK